MQLTDDIKFIKGVGPKRAEAFYASAVYTAIDLLNLIPRRYISHKSAIPISQLKVDDYVTIVGKVMTCGVQRGRKKRFVIALSDGTGICQAVWFNFINSIQEKVKKGLTIAISGKVGYFGGYQITHPELEIISESDKFERQDFIVPVYPLSDALRKANVSSSHIKKYIHNILHETHIPKELDTLPISLVEKYKFNSLNDAYLQIHFPENEDQAKDNLARFKYEELFHLQLYLLMRKLTFQHRESGISFDQVGQHFQQILNALDFELTAAQKRVIKEIRRDMKNTLPMNRLLQGDVGSGKTIVAILCIAIAIDNNYQTAFMAPTEILAEQHYLNLLKFATVANLRITFLSGSLKASQKKERLQDIANGMVDIVVGTHAIIEDAVHFNNLGFIVIDEQHRFGVMQRAKLSAKGKNPDLLVMTATPIPRTMALTVYGDLDVSIIDELPPGRIEIKTVWRFDNKEQEVYQFIKEKVRGGDQVYIVFPLVEESEKIDLKSATESYEKLKEEAFADLKLGLLHGRMKASEKEVIMSEFKNHKLDILVSTTVIEVGVDIPNASIMVVEHAERFGLSQLHQLRGRVGRGKKESFCILKTPYNLGQDARERMEIICKTNDGFKLAEEDLRIRGIGELFGTKQSGFSDLKFANLVTDQILLQYARKDAEELIENDPHLRKNEHQILKDIVVNQYQKKFGLIDIA
jgi:ATP-dependent DNA helicase RecG